MPILSGSIVAPSDATDSWRSATYVCRDGNRVIWIALYWRVLNVDGLVNCCALKGPDGTQSTVYEKAAQPSIISALNGFNACLFVWVLIPVSEELSYTNRKFPGGVGERKKEE